MNLNKSIHVSCHGIVKRLREVDDKHLANIIHYVEYYHPGDRDFIKELRIIAKNRGLTEFFLCLAPYSYICPDGEKVIWDYRLSRPRPAGQYE